MASDGDTPGTGQAVQSPPETQMPETQPLEIPKTDTSKAATSASRRVRARLARRMTAQRSTVNPVLEPLVAVHSESYPEGRPDAAAARIRGGRAAPRRPVAPLR